MIDSLKQIPLPFARAIPYGLVICLLTVAMLYGRRALAQQQKVRNLQRSVRRIMTTKSSIDNYLAVTNEYLPKLVAAMRAGIDKLVDERILSRDQASPLLSQIKDLDNVAGKIIISNQVATAKAAREDKVIVHVDPKIYTSIAVWLPALITFGLIIGVNVVFMAADMYTASPFRIAIELGVCALAAFLVGWAYHYQHFLKETERLTAEQLTHALSLYTKREAYLPEAAEQISQQYRLLQVAQEPLKGVKAAQPFNDAFDKLAHLEASVSAAHTYSMLSKTAPLYDVSAFMNKTLAAFSNKDKAKQITIDARINPGIKLRIHPQEIAQLLRSLIDNAIKYSNYGGKIQVLLFRRFNSIVLSVSDYGIGMSGKQLPKLLDPFAHSGTSNSTNSKGVSLGLYSDKIIVDKLGGSISIRSQAGVGTIVTVTLPVEREALDLNFGTEFDS